MRHTSTTKKNSALFFALLLLFENGIFLRATLEIALEINLKEDGKTRNGAVLVMDHVRTKPKREKLSDLAELRARLQGNAYYAALIKGDYVAKPPRYGDEPKIEIVQNIGVGFSGSDALRDQFRHDSNSKEERLTLHKLGNWLEESINHLEEPEPELKKKEFIIIKNGRVAKITPSDSATTQPTPSKVTDLAQNEHMIVRGYGAEEARAELQEKYGQSRRAKVTREELIGDLESAFRTAYQLQTAPNYFISSNYNGYISIGGRRGDIENNKIFVRNVVSEEFAKSVSSVPQHLKPRGIASPPHLAGPGPSTSKQNMIGTGAAAAGTMGAGAGVSPRLMGGALRSKLAAKLDSDMANSGSTKDSVAQVEGLTEEGGIAAEETVASAAEAAAAETAASAAEAAAAETAAEVIAESVVEEVVVTAIESAAIGVMSAGFVGLAVGMIIGFGIWAVYTHYKEAQADAAIVNATAIERDAADNNATATESSNATNDKAIAINATTTV